MMTELSNFVISYSEEILGIVGFILFLSFLWKNRVEDEGDTMERLGSSLHSSTASCGSPTCLRCRAKNLTEFQNSLWSRFNEFCQLNTCNFKMRERIASLIKSSTNKNSILCSVFAEAGYVLDTEEDVYLHPHVWIFPELTRRPYWNVNLSSYLSKLAFLEAPQTVSSVKSEFDLVNKSKEGWKFNSVPCGKWRVFSLYDQGKANEENCKKCPNTVELLWSIESFMNDHVFGNAMFSILEPGSRIEPHVGPCNFRLRCHLPITVRSRYVMKVGKDTNIWEEGKLMIFDDSFVHEVWSESTVGALESEFGRAVLIFDIWHPEVVGFERKLVSHIFNHE